MANTYRGETPFRALGREMFLVYRTQEIAAMQAAMGLGRPDPVRTSTTVQVPALNLKRGAGGGIEHVVDEDGCMLAALNEDGSPKMRTIVVSAAELHRRHVEAFDAAFMHPTAADLLVMIRCGLEPWERLNGKLTSEQFDLVAEELGFIGLSLLHQKAVENSYRVMVPMGEEAKAGSDDANSQSPAPASQT